jgi:hypothetical protein
LKKFNFPSASPPKKDDWAYKAIGPFTTGGMAGGAYCVATALNFLSEKVARESNWVPSFTMRDAAGREFEADCEVQTLDEVCFGTVILDGGSFAANAIILGGKIV